MKHFLIFIFIILFPFLVSAQTVSINENFETGLPASAPSSETSVTLSSGVWKINGVSGGTDNGSVRMRMNGNGTAITPLINKPVSVSFDHRGSGSGKILTVSKSIDNGANWTSIGNVTVSSSSTYGNANFSVSEAGTRNVLLRFHCNSATIFVDNVRVTSSDMGDEPTQQASISASDITGSSVKITFQKGNGAGRLLVYSKDTQPIWIPEDGTQYTNLPKALDDNLMLVHSGDVGELTVSGLTAGENYHFAVFEYTNESNTPNYLTSTIGRLQVRTAEVPTFTVTPSAINFGSVKTGTSAKRSFTLSGKYLQPTGSGELNLIASPDFLISTQQTSGFAQSITLPIAGATLDQITVYVQFNPTELKSYTHNLSIIGGLAQATVSLIGTGSNTDAKVYYISPQGNDSNQGTYDSPWYNLQRAVNLMVPGDTVICRGGIYYPTTKQDGTKTTVRLNAKGSADKWFTIKNYPGEFPVLNFRDQPKKVSVRGIQLNGNYWHVYGLHITEAGDNGMKIEGSYNRIERCTFSYNDDTGLQLGFGHDFSATGFGSSNDGSYCAYNDIIDCDAYLNCDSDNYGSDADGFACKMHNGIGNRFIRCRAWDNADDAWDMFETDYAVYLIECWAWGSGRANLFGWVQASGSFQGNGNGIKLGGNGTGGNSKGIHEAWNCVAFNNNKTGSVKGFDQNSHGGGEKIINCLAFGNGYDFMFERAAANRSYHNNVCFGNIEIASGSTESYNGMLSSSTKAWTNNIIRGFSMSDYVSLTEEDAKAPRGDDGSMPKKFARLKAGSVLIDKGLSLDMPFTAEFPFLAQPVFGAARDLGPYEYVDANVSSVPQIIINRDAKLNLEILPNPCKTEAVMKFSADFSGKANIEIYSLSGQIVKNALQKQLDAGIEYFIPVNVEELKSGTYLCRLQIENQSKTVRLIVVR
jgi:hypothetical protein